MAKNTKKEPLFRMSKRGEVMPGWKAWGTRFIGFLLSLVVSAVVIFAITGLNPIEVFAKMGEGAFGSAKKSWVTVRDAMTMLCIAVGLAPAFKMRFWNIGAEGQILVGGLASAACMIYLKSLPGLVLIIVMMITSLIAGGLWGLLPAVFKAKWNTNETLFTLMMNYIAIQLTSFFVAQWENPPGSNSVGVINGRTGNQGWLPNLFSSGFNKDFGWNVIIVLAVTLFMYLYLNKSKHGYEISVIGDSQRTARYAGIRVNYAFVRTMVLSGAICGLAGFVAVSGSSHTISTSTAGGRGFTAIIVAWLAQFNSIVMIIFSFLLVVLQKGAQQIATSFGLNKYISEMITGIILFFLLGSEFFVNYKLRFRGRKEK
ncbi:MAG: ABC transporter permease [Clostridia bacterium]|nr:ABC transporter permease [Clostridia bacterium]